MKRVFFLMILWEVARASAPCRQPQANDAGKGFKLGLKHVVGLAVQFQHGHGHVAAAFVEHVVDVDLAGADGGGDVKA